MTSEAGLKIRLLGPLEVRANGVPVGIPGRRPRALLAVLALSAGQPVPVETLYERVWGEDLPGNVRGSLYSCVRRLRTVLGDDAIGSAAGRYTLNVAPDAVDAIRFSDLLDRAFSAGPDQVGSLIREALALWHGTPFAEPLSDWLNEVESQRLTERHLSAVEHRTDAELAIGAAGSIAELQRLAADHPLRETLWARLIVALARSGRQAEALAAYEQIRRRLADELGIDPSRELQAIYAELLNGTAPSASLAGSAAPAPVVPRQLPAAGSDFTGRQDALTELDQHLAEVGDVNQPVVITGLHGMGGVGKTTLALHWAHQVSERFADGQLFVNLRGYGPGQPMPASAALDLLLRGIGVPGEDIPADIDARSALFRSRLAGRRMLIVLDNARDAEQVRPLVPGSGSMVLVTSRGQLRGLAAREGARRISLDTLSEEESVALLVARLAEQGVTRHLSGLAELARLCGYLPLALVIAAERAGRYADGLAVVVQDLQDERDRLSALESDDETTSLRAVFSWSYQALDADAARMFRLLGLPPGADVGVGAVAALAGTGIGTARRLLDRLAELSLVERRAAGRFGLHDHLRAYAAELCRDLDAEHDRRTALDRLYGWCVQSATNAALVENPRTALSRLPTPSDIDPATFDDDRMARDWLRLEADFAVALAQGAADDRPDVVYRLVHALYEELWRRQAFDQLSTLLDRALDAARQTGDQWAEAKTHNLIALYYLTVARYSIARPHLEHSINLFEAAGDTQGQVAALNTLGLIECTVGRPLTAINHFQEALDLAHEHGDPLGEAGLLNNVAGAYQDLSQYDAAAEAAQRALAIYRGHGSLGDQAMVLDTLGEVYTAANRHDEAIPCLQQAKSMAQTLGDRPLEAIATANFARALRDAGQLDEARQNVLAAISLMDSARLADFYDLRRSDLVELLASVSPVQSA
ncbi:AfsR/SARP family transcriptional regulator [Nocardioides speluncae]|uniref:AfsR/SARP family transcriptional regulator n=1 Tax=Nocardioides speluncae TaxID=2670337 RepID=UPI00137A6ECA|nr:BTAD domain-containing putative transcriptional regulator [Nocardioides speluncae]